WGSRALRRPPGGSAPSGRAAQGRPARPAGRSPGGGPAVAGSACRPGGCTSAPAAPTLAAAPSSRSSRARIVPFQGERKPLMAFRAGIVLLALVGLLTLAPEAGAGRTANVAGLQVGLHARGLYRGTIDGIMGPATRRGVRVLQRRAGIPVDGIAGP